MSLSFPQGVNDILTKPSERNVFCCSYMLDLIKNSRKCLDVCIYIITAKLFGDAIIDAHKRGVRVRVIADSDMSFSVQSFINVFREHGTSLYLIITIELIINIK